MNNIFQEETVYDKENRYPVFIVLTYGDNPLGMAISKLTGDEWTHSLISFNPELKPMYSFATRTQKSDKPQSLFGFVYQDTKDKWYAHKETKYLVYVMYVTKEARKKMQERLDYFIKHERESKYDFAGLINIWKNKDSETHRKYFCSRFVAEILGQGVPLEKLPSLYRPQELNDLNNISLVNAGKDMYEYNPKITLKNMKRIRENNYNKRKYQSDEIASHVRIAESAADRFINGILSYDKFLDIYDELL
jgi:hypothetical protein